MTRLTIWTGMLAAIATAACSGDLEDPARFDSLHASGTSGMSDCPDIPELFQMQCALGPCHDDTGPAADLVLNATPEANLVGVESTQCEGWLRIDPSNPEQSLLLDKLGPEPTCGERMPVLGFGEFLDEATIACVAAWAAEVAGGAP